MDKIHKTKIDSVNEKFEDEMKAKDIEFEAMEKDFRRKIDMLLTIIYNQSKSMKST